MSFRNLIYFFPLVLILQYTSFAQTQEEQFATKLSEIYTHVENPSKALVSAKELYKMVEKTKALQTYSNYYILNQVFETQAPDKDLAERCKVEANKALALLSGGGASGEWFNKYYPALFKTNQTDNATNALAYLKNNETLQNYNNFTYVAYAFERNGDFRKAKETYEMAIAIDSNAAKEYHSYSFYTNFLSRSGDYLKAEEYIKKMEKLSIESSELLQKAYISEALTSKVVYYLSIGDYHSYVQACEDQSNIFTAMYANTNACDPTPSSRYTYMAYGKEMLKEYQTAEVFWAKRDSSEYAWKACHNKQYPEHKQYPLSMLPVYLIKTQRQSMLKKPISYYIEETETHFNSYREYADMSINFLKATHLGFLGSPQYHEFFKPVLTRIRINRDYREATVPFVNYAYFNMRDRKLSDAKELYAELFKLNVGWINDVIFSFGEKAFVTYYNAKLKDGYENFHSFVKLSKEAESPLFSDIAIQAYNNLLFTKSLSLKGVQKRKQAFLKTSDQSTIKLYEDWLAGKEALIRLYRKTESGVTDSTNLINEQQLQRLHDQVNKLENELTVKSKDFKMYLKINPPDWKKVKSQLKDGEAAIEMIRFQWRDQLYYSDTSYYAAYIITKSSTYPEVVYLPDLASELDNKYYNYYRNNIRYKYDDTISYNHYWKPIVEQLNGIQKVYFSPDGIYHLINLSTLKDPNSGSYLLDQLDIHQTTSSADLEERSPVGRIDNAVLFGRPSYKVDQPNPVDTNLKEETQRSLSDFRGNNIADLPGTEEEVMGIQKEMDNYKINVKLFLREAASEEKLYSVISPDILHIATHGYWSPSGKSTNGYRIFNAMVNSGLLFSGVVNYYNAANFLDTYDGILTAYEAQNLNLENTSLVVLSACETSLGHFDAGEGIYGLQRAFRAAGAKSIMTSLWKVDDLATKDFMLLFYKRYLESGNKTEAFKFAQKKLKEKYPSPYYWGAFVLTGI